MANDAAVADAATQQTNQESYEWTLNAYEQQGNLWLSWSTTGPFRAQQDKIEVYQDGYPGNPDSNAKKWTWANPDNSPWDTGLTYGSDWYCARIAQSPPNEGYVYVNQIITD